MAVSPNTNWVLISSKSLRSSAFTSYQHYDLRSFEQRHFPGSTYGTLGFCTFCLQIFSSSYHKTGSKGFKLQNMIGYHRATSPLLRPLSMSGVSSFIAGSQKLVPIAKRRFGAHFWRIQSICVQRQGKKSWQTSVLKNNRPVQGTQEAEQH